MSTNEISVEERNRAAKEERIAGCRAILQRIGFSDCPDGWTAEPWKFRPEWFVCDPQGKIIICRNLWANHIAETFNSLLGREIEAETMPMEDGGEIAVFASGSVLPLPERHTLSVMVRYFDEYRPGFRAQDGEINLPHALHALAAPVNFVDEADAYQLATAIDELFPGTADIVTTDEGYAVVVHDEDGDLSGWASERIAAVVGIVSRFNLTHKEKECIDIPGTLSGSCSAAPWQLRVAELHAQQQRIESALGEILSRLTPNAATGAETPSTATTRTKGRGLEALVPSGGKKSSGKKSA